MDWMTFKDMIASLFVDRDALHVYIGVTIQMLAAYAFNRSIGSWLPWLCVLAVNTVNEAVDLTRNGEFAITDYRLMWGLHDYINTMILPTVLLLLVRYAPRLFAWQRATA